MLRRLQKIVTAEQCYTSPTTGHCVLFLRQLKDALRRATRGMNECVGRAKRHHIKTFYWRTTLCTCANVFTSGHVVKNKPSKPMIFWKNWTTSLITFNATRTTLVYHKLHVHILLVPQLNFSPFQPSASTIAMIALMVDVFPSWLLRFFSF